MNQTKLIFLLFFSLGSLSNLKAQQGTWTLMKGSPTGIISDSGVFGRRGVALPTNNPPSLYEAAEWTDAQGNFWLFGGLNSDCFSALWKFNPATNMWTWIKGPKTLGAYGVYGLKGIPDTSNNPGARSYGSLAWTDHQNNLWLFGGFGYSKSSYGSLADLWKYNIATNTWTWMSGTDTIYSLGRYGIQGIPSIYNYPENRNETSVSWVDNVGNLWLFGGAGSRGTYQYLNDLWKYDVSSNMWTWIKGDSIQSIGSYGIKGISNVSNEPPGRCAYSRWKDVDGNFWMFGGFSYNYGYLNDLWKYDLSTNMWTWINGSDIIDEPGNQGTPCINSNTNSPSSRMEAKACWTDAFNNFWLFGGRNQTQNTIYLNDFWYYNVQSNEWTLVNEGSGPSSRIGSMSFIDNNGDFWLYGGYYSSGSFPNTIFKYFYNDLWHYTTDTNCSALYSSVHPIKNPCSNPNCIIVFPNPNNGVFNLQIDERLKDFSITIMDIYGRTILYQKSNNSVSKRIDISKQANGIYYLIFNSSSKQYRTKVLVYK